MQYMCSTMHQCLHFYENWVNSWQTITGSLEKLNKCKKGTHFAPDWYYWFHFSHVMGTTLHVNIIPPYYAKCTPGAVWVPKPEIVNLAPILPQTKNLTCWKVPIGYNLLQKFRQDPSIISQVMAISRFWQSKNCATWKNASTYLSNEHIGEEVEWLAKNSHLSAQKLRFEIIALIASSASCRLVSVTTAELRHNNCDTDNSG